MDIKMLDFNFRDILRLGQTIPTLSGVTVGFESFLFSFVLLTISVTHPVSVEILVFLQESFVNKRKKKEKGKAQ